MKHAVETYAAVYEDLLGTIDQYRNMQIPLVGIIGVLDILRWDLIKEAQENGDEE